jgi:hypothetical protein
MGYAEDNEKLAVHLPNSDLEVDENNLQLFFSTMFERQEIWYRRFILKKERPWTENEIFQNYKFTNVYRELDRNSQYQIKNIFNNFSLKGKRKELIWQIMFYRFFNNPDFFEFIHKYKLEADEAGFEDYSLLGSVPAYDNFNPECLKDFMEAFRVDKGNPFTNAYLTNSQACPGKTRDECFAFKVIPTLHKMIPEISNILIKAKSPQEIIKVLLKLPSVSNFMAHEFYQDFTYAPRYSGMKLMRFDQDDYTNVGPGADAGIRWIFPNRKTGKEKLQAIYDLRDLAVEYLSEFGDFKYLGYNSESNNYYYDTFEQKITLHQIEMYLCEFQKYKKMQLKLGKQRSKFIPKTKVK